MDAGYSGTPLAKKLGIKPGDQLLLLNAPTDFESKLESIAGSVFMSRELGDADSWDVIVQFTTERERVSAFVDVAIQRIQPNGAWWIAWPKKASKVPTDIVEQTLRDLLLTLTPFVDNKVCAIDHVWSGLRFVRRRSAR